MTLSDDAHTYAADCPTITLSKGQILIFGYGSLLLPGSMESTLGRAYDRPRFPCGVKGWRRSWNAYMPNRSYYEPSGDGEFVPRNIIYLNVRPAPDTIINGVLYLLDAEEIEAFDRREWIYSRQSIENPLVGVSVQGGSAFIYVGQPLWTLDPEDTVREVAAIRRSYLRMVDEGLDTLGTDFRASYEQSTDPIPSHLVFADRSR
jgi:cation transport regulator ChaC